MLCPYDISVPGGVQGQARGLTSSLRKAGHEVLLLTVGTATTEQRSADDGGASYRLGRSMSLPANRSRAPVSLSPIASLRARRLVATTGCDVIHLHEPLAPLLGYACLASPIRPMVGTFHRSGPSTAYRIFSPVTRGLASRLALRCAVSESAARTARAALGGDYVMTFNGIDVDRFDHPGTPPAPSTVLFCGRHEERKGLEVLLRAFERLSEPATLWVVGEGPLTPALKRRYPPSQRRLWLGRISDDELAQRMDAAAIVCAPSLGGESFGVVILEAMAARTPIIAADISGYRRAAHGHAYLVPPADADALARALDAVLIDTATSTGRASPRALQAAFEHARGWSMDRLADIYVDLYTRCLLARQG